MNSRLKRLEPLWRFLDTHEITVEDLLACICISLEDYPAKEFEHEFEIGSHKWKCTFEKERDLTYPFKVL